MIAMKVFIFVHVCVCVCNEIQVLYPFACLVEINLDLNDENYMYNTA